MHWLNIDEKLNRRLIVGTVFKIGPKENEHFDYCNYCTFTILILPYISNTFIYSGVQKHYDV